MIVNNKYLFGLCFLYCTNLLSQIDSLHYLNIIKNSDVFSKVTLQNATLDIKGFKTLNDTVYVKFNLNKISDSASVVEYNGIIYKTLFKLHGNYKSTFDNGSSAFMSQGKIIENMTTGINYNYTDGNINNLYATVENARNGITIFYEENKVKQIYFYRNDTLNGNYILFYSNGNVKESGEYKKGNKFGLFLSYYSDGSLKVKGQYSGKYISAEPDKNSNKMLFFLNSKIKIDFISKYSLQLKTELSDEMKQAGGYQDFKYYLKEGRWLYYDAKGRIIKSISYNKNGDIR